jgi:valyl-tRNA synthetase
MSLAKHYDPQEAEKRLANGWQVGGVYRFEPDSRRPVFSIDTPPPTVSGHLHLGHCYSYSHTDFIARFWRMNGYEVFYPMGFDDNGLPTERLVEKRLGITAAQVGRTAFIEKCLEISDQAEADYQALWQRLGLSIDWRYTYRTIDRRARRISQLSFIDLARKGLAYRRQAPAIWCPECRTALAQADLNDMERESEYVTLRFALTPIPSPKGRGVIRLPLGEGRGEGIFIATTRPELLPACVAVFVHPEDGRYWDWVGKTVRVPLFGQEVPVLEDPAADPEKGTGAVMCCTFGDATDVAWQRAHDLPILQAIDRGGRMTDVAGLFAGLPVDEARRRIKEALAEQDLITGRQPTQQTIRVHERCDTPVEYILAPQWFIRVLDFKQALLEAGQEVRWRPEHMKARYTAWVENLSWDWCISRQRYYGVPFPVWYCADCGEIILADEDRLPLDPSEQGPAQPCSCGCTRFQPETDILDTWATSSVSPQIVGDWLQEDHPGLYEQVFPFSLRPQAHDIIRTWAFYTIAKSHFHFDVLPWKEAMISGWGTAGEGMGKISKSRGGGPMPPMQMIERHSADAVRYWAASAAPGKDSVISEDKIQNGARLATKLWNVARFSERFLQETQTGEDDPALRTPADRWILARLQQVIRRTTAHFQDYDYASAKNEVEDFFWRDLADNYLEMCKLRLYDAAHPQRPGALHALQRALLDTLKMLAPILPFVTEEIYQGLFPPSADALPAGNRPASIHTATWPAADPALDDEGAEAFGLLLVQVATAVRRYKSEHSLALGSELARVQIVPAGTPGSGSGWSGADWLAAIPDLKGITRAREIELAAALDPALIALPTDGDINLAIEEID